MNRCAYILIIAVLLLSNMNTAMAQSRNSLIIARDHLILQIDLQSPKKSIDSILNIAGINIQYTDQVLKGDFSVLDKDGWNRTERQNNIVRFDRSLTDLNENPQSAPYLITSQMPQLDGKPGYPAEVKYGVNKFAKVTVYGLSSGLTRFILPGYTNVKRVFLSGNFNNWSTLKGVMKKMDGGWVIDIKLEAGAYEYKYIIGGHWSTDPNNLAQTDDGVGNVNSVFYKYNYTFRLKGYTSARKITLVGDFNNWNTDELSMVKRGDGWEKQLYLNDGKHSYHYLADGNWITDPGNLIKEKDDNGNLNSVLNIGEIVRFKLNGFADAKKVYVAGDFNNWKPDELMLKNKQGSWILSMVLGAGNYNYKFIIDGKWMPDPMNPNYSTSSGEVNSFLSVRPNRTFKLNGNSGANTVRLAGTFNNWNPNGYTLAHKGDDWTISLYLKPGKYLYKFIVDGKWILDPSNKLWEQNEHHNGNSVLWIE